MHKDPESTCTVLGKEWVFHEGFLASFLSLFSFAIPQNECIKTLEKEALQVGFLGGLGPGPPLHLWHLISAETKV